VCGVEDAELAHGLGDKSFGGKVHDRVYFVPRENSVKLSAICEINLAIDGIGRHVRTLAFDHAVQGDDRHAARNQYFRTDTADVTRCARNKNIHHYVLLESGRKPK